MKCPVKVAQQQSELDWLLELYKRLRPKRVLEIGSLYGGTLWHWMRDAEPGALTVSLDYMIYTEHKKVALIRESRKLWHGWAEGFGVTLRTIYGDSTLPETVEQAEKYAPFDFIFVDGGHLYKIVDSDFRTYWPMLRPGGKMAFHDIAYEPGNKRSQPVGLWWHERIRPLPFKCLEMIVTPGIYGIGVLERPGD